jgi:UPF0755 protein
MAFVGFELYRLMYQPMPIPPGESVVIRVDKTTTATSLTHNMHAQGWIGPVRLWLWCIRIQGFSAKLKAGIYQVQAGESAQHLLKRIVAGEVLREQFLIRPGTTQQHITTDFQTARFLDYHPEDWSILAGNTVTRSTSTHNEGLLLADTYNYDAGDSAKSIIKQAHAHLLLVLNHAWQTRDTTLPYQSAYELLIAASIIEKESALAAERRLISGVIVNRLRKHMPLQMDPTVIYALGSAYHSALSHAEMGVDSPYNTYKYRGLPPTPIAMVSADALDAASHPDMQPYLYFVAKGDGSHVFSSNYGAHREAINRYMRKSR